MGIEILQSLQTAKPLCLALYGAQKQGVFSAAISLRIGHEYLEEPPTPLI